MRIALTPDQIRMLASRAERQLEQAMAASMRESLDHPTIPRACHGSVHDAVVSLVKLYRDHVPGKADIATQIAREYARGANPLAGGPSVASVRSIHALSKRVRISALAEPAGDGERLA
ncbi:hypothetical protein [Massilia sp. DD77]|uniref:hypothetical protein n=1 Tax=Massilia sp. DD77 TaxID=3109349 RepID=UPI002FFF77C4